jgi:hypothetical protein
MWQKATPARSTLECGGLTPPWNCEGMRAMYAPGLALGGTRACIVTRQRQAAALQGAFGTKTPTMVSSESDIMRI